LLPNVTEFRHFLSCSLGYSFVDD
jgi:hypothetical protein